jgi:4-hydroxy-3-polyprenylbenzoate decarboxylase
MTNINHEFQGKITLAITGASGAGYALRLMECLIAAHYQLYVLVSSAGRIVLDTELGIKIPGSPDSATQFLTDKYQAQPGQIKVFGKEQWFSPVASGSAAPKKNDCLPMFNGHFSSYITWHE